MEVDDRIGDGVVVVDPLKDRILRCNCKCLKKMSYKDSIFLGGDGGEELKKTKRSRK